jgi:hypothetical protein
MTRSVRDFYAAIGVVLPERGGANVSIRCFANPGAHRRDDRSPSCSVNLENGAWCCHGCGVRGGAYDAALALGRQPREAMELLPAHGLVGDDEPRADDDLRQNRPVRRTVAAQGARPADSEPRRQAFAMSEADVDGYREQLAQRPDLIARLTELRGWTPAALVELGLGFDGDRIVFPVCDTQGRLVGVVRYSPNPASRNGLAKMLADAGSVRELFPAPESIDTESLWIVEGEPDAVAARSLGLTAVAVPGANGWKREWASRFGGRRVVLVPDTDDPGRALMDRVASELSAHTTTTLLDLGALAGARNGGGYDLGDALIDAAHDGPSSIRWLRCKLIKASATESSGRAPTGSPSSNGRATAQHRVDPPDLAREPDLLARVVAELRDGGLVGEARAVALVYLAVTSRLLERPVSLALKAPSSAGKSYIVEQALSLFPPEAFYALTAMSEKALIYSEESLDHRMLVLYEAAGMAGEWASYLVRSLLSEGRIRYETVDRRTLKTKFIEREGPTGLIVTTTAVSLHPENETRLLSVPVSDTPEQTRSILLAQAEERDPQLDTARWHSLQRWLAQGRRSVTVPFAVALAKLVPPAAIRLRRDFPTVLALVKTHALLHRATRSTDENGRILATLDDYAAVRGLVADLIAEQVQSAVSPQTRETVEAVARLRSDGAERVSLGALARSLGLDKSAVSRRAQKAREAGYLVNDEDRRGKPAKYRLGEALPEEQPLLPDVEQLSDVCCSVARPARKGRA